MKSKSTKPVLKQYKVEKNIPLPKIRVKQIDMYPMSQMKVGDSFLIDDKPHKNVNSHIYYYAKKSNIKIAVRVVGLNKTRVWRVK